MEKAQPGVRRTLGNGLSLAWREWNSGLAGLPIVLLSGFIEPAKMESLRALGLREILTKPPSSADLAAAIHRRLHGSTAPFAFR